MSQPLPDWVAWIVVSLVVGGSALSLLGAAGLVRLNSFYDRVHAPTLGATLGMALILLGSWIYFGVAQGRWIPRELLIAVFLTVTTPVTLTLLARAALFRDRTESSESAETPAPGGGEDAGD
jgi:multicomponent K+:H+ antiporter subunit G